MTRMSSPSPFGHSDPALYPTRGAEQRIPAGSMKTQVSKSSRVLDQYRPAVSPVADGPLCGAGLDDGVRCFIRRASSSGGSPDPCSCATDVTPPRPGCASRQARTRMPSPPGPTAPAAVLGFRRDAAMESFAVRNGGAVAMPAPELTRALGDKTRLPALAGCWGACPAIDHQTGRAGQRR
jgi:hypothetical protein